MAVKRITTVFQFRRDTTENWLLNKDVIPAAGEPCFDLDLHVLKIGDGKTTYENLPAIGGVELKIEADGKSIVLEDGIFKLMGFDEAEVDAQPRKTANGGIEWVVPSTEIVDGLKSAVDSLQSEVKTLQEIVNPSGEGEVPLLTRIDDLEKEMNAIVSGLTDDGKVNTLMELIEYAETHGKEAADMATDIMTLQGLVGTTPVSEQIMTIVNESEKKTKAIFEHVKYEIADTPAGTLVDYRDKEIRVMVPANAVFTKQAVGAGGDANNYYMIFKTYVPNDNVVGYIEHLNGQSDSEILTNLSTDKYGRRYQPTWLSLAKYDEATDAWTYYGKSSTVRKYIGWDYQIDWYDADGVMVASDKIRINLSNEDCYNNIEPYYMANVVKEVAVNGTLMDVVEGRVNVTVPVLKGSDEIDVAEDGTLSIKSISIDKIVQSEETVIVMDGGGAV